MAYSRIARLISTQTSATVKLETSGHISFGNGALATSTPFATGFTTDALNAQLKIGHIFDPSGGGPLRRPGWNSAQRSVTVFAPTAAMADGLSTAFAMMSDEAIRIALAKIEHEIKVYSFG